MKEHISRRALLLFARNVALNAPKLVAPELAIVTAAALKVGNKSRDPETDRFANWLVDKWTLFGLMLRAAACASAPAPHEIQTPGIYPGDQAFLIPDAPARNIANHAPIRMITDPLIDPGRISLVRWNHSPLQSLVLNTPFDSSILMGTHPDQPGVAFPVVKASPDILIPQLESIANGVDVPAVSIDDRAFLDGLFASPNIGLRVNSRDLQGTFRFDFGGQSYSVGGRKDNLNKPLRIIELMPTGKDRLVLVQILGDDGQVLGYRTVSAGVLTSDMRAPQNHYLLRHAQDAQLGDGHLLQPFLENIPTVARAGFRSLWSGIPYTDPVSGVEYTPLMTLGIGRYQKIVCQCTLGENSLGSVVMFGATIDGRDWTHGFRPGISLEADAGITSYGSYLDGYTVIQQALQSADISGKPATVKIMTTSGLVEVPVLLFRQTNFELLLEKWRAELPQLKLPPQAGGLARWPGWRQAASSVLTVNGYARLGLAYSLNRHGPNSNVIANLADALQISTTQWVEGMNLVGTPLSESGEVDVNNLLGKAQSAPDQLFYTKLESGHWADLSSNGPDGIYFTVTQETAEDEAHLYVHPVSESATAIVLPGDTDINYLPLTAGNGVNVPNETVDTVPTQEDWNQHMRYLLVENVPLPFAYRKIVYENVDSEGRTTEITETYLTTFIRYNPDGTTDRKAYVFVYRKPLT